MTDTLTVLDATFLELEQLDAGALMSIGGTMIFDPLPDGGVPSLEELRTSLAARLPSLPRYTQRLSEARTGRLVWPHWEPDPHFELTNHLRHAALPFPGDDRQLCDFTAEFFSHPLDRSRPLWELVLVEGLEQGRWALVHKVHHCLVDGVGSADVVGLLLDRAPQPEAEPAPAVETDVVAPPRLPAPLAQAGVTGTHAVQLTLNAAMHPRRALERSRAFAELIVRDELIGAPPSSLNVPIGQSRRYAVVRAPLAECKAIGRELGGSFNDVMLTVCTGGLRRLLESRCEPLPPHGLRAMVPVNLRSGDDLAGVGNRVSSLFVNLPVGRADPAARLRRIATSTRRLKQTDAAHGATALLELASLAPPAILAAALARTSFSRRLFNLTITNVPGSPVPLYAFGARLREVDPIVPLAAEHAVGIAIFSHDGLVTIGINADLAAVPDLDVLAYGIEDSLEELRALAPGARTVHTPTEMRV